MCSVTKKIAEFTYNTNFINIPINVIKQANRCFLDLIGVTILGSRNSLSSILINRYISEYFSFHTASIIGYKIKTAIPTAAFINSTMGHVLEFDDIKLRIGHPSVTVIPAVLAIGEYLGSSGKEVLTAYVIGVEVSSKIADWLEPEQKQRGWTPTCTSGIFGVVAAVGKLLGLNSKQLIHAFGLAASFAAGLGRNSGTMSKAIQVGKTAENGINASLFSKIGVTADTSIFTGKYGFMDVFSGKNDTSCIFTMPSKNYEVMKLGFKMYPCCASTHTAIDSIIFLQKEEPIPIENIKNIRIGTVPINIQNLIYNFPRTPFEAKYSMQFCVSIALLEGKVLPHHFSKEWLENSQLQNLMKKIGMFHHPDLVTLGYRGTENAIVEIEFKDGSKRSTRTDIPKGHPQNALSNNDLIQKFTLCTNGILEKQIQIKLIDIVLNLDHEETLNRLMRLTSEEI